MVHSGYCTLQNTAPASPCTVNTHHESRPFHTIHRALQFPMPRRKQVIPNLVIPCMAQRHGTARSHARNVSSTKRGSRTINFTHIPGRKQQKHFQTGPIENEKQPESLLSSHPECSASVSPASRLSTTPQSTCSTRAQRVAVRDTANSPAPMRRAHMAFVCLAPAQNAAERTNSPRRS